MLRRIAWVAAMLVNPAANAQVFVVDRAGGGDFTDLQVALDTVFNGATLVLRGRFAIDGGSFLVTKSVQLVGEPGAYVEAGHRDGAFIIDAPGKRVVISTLEILGERHNVADGADGVLIENDATVILDHCDVRGGSVQDITSCEIATGAGDGVRVSGSCGFLLVQYCVLAGTTATDQGGFGCACTYIQGCNGGDGLNCEASAVTVVVESVVSGGAGSDANWICTDGCAPDDWVEAGDGGTGLRGNAFVSNSSFTGGKGGNYDEDFYAGDCADPWGVDGIDGEDVTGSITDLPAKLAVGLAGIGDLCTVVGYPLVPNGL